MRFVNGTRLLSTAIAVAGTGWIAYLVHTTTDSLGELLPENASPLVMALLCLAGSLFVPALIFHSLVREEMEDRSLAVRLHFTGQLLKYLPGRVWGVLYQISSTNGSISGLAIVRANVDFMLVAVVVNAAVAVVALGLGLGWSRLAMLATVLCGTAGLSLHFVGMPDAMVRGLHAVLPKSIHESLSRFIGSPRGAAMLLRLLALQLISFSLYITAWTFLVDAYPRHTDVDATTLALIYALASIIGMLSVVTPAGLGVREASFVTLGLGIAPVDSLALFAVLARTWLFTTEIVLSAACIAVTTLLTSVESPQAVPSARNAAVEEHANDVSSVRSD